MAVNSLYPFRDYDDKEPDLDGGGEPIAKPTRTFRFEIRVQMLDETSPLYVGVDTAPFAQQMCKEFSEMDSCEIKWRDWEKVDSRTNEPIWVVFQSW